MQVEALQREIRKLNPKPGAALGETEGRSLQQITPDFIVDTADDGTVTFSLNCGQLPELKVSSSFKEMADAYKQNKEGMSRQTKEALLYAKEKVARAQGYITAIKQRQHTMMLTMGAIIEWQKRFFQEGDETELRPMILSMPKRAGEPSLCAFSSPIPSHRALARPCRYVKCAWLSKQLWTTRISNIR